MNLLLLAFIGYAAFGFGAAALMHVLFDIAIVRLSNKELFETISKISGWFLGNGALAFTSLKLFNLNSLLSNPSATGLAVVSYMFGFGATCGLLAVRVRPSIVRSLNQVLNNRQLEVLLLVLRYDFSVDEAADKLQISKDGAAVAFEDALKSLRRRGNEVFKSLRVLQPLPNALANNVEGTATHWAHATLDAEAPSPEASADAGTDVGSRNCSNSRSIS